MDQIKQWLRRHGLNDTEIAVYTCLLEYPDIKASDIQRQTGLVRSTIYYALAQLKTDGLLSENMQNNVKTYRCADIQALKRSVEQDIIEQKHKLEQLDEIEDVFKNFVSKRPSEDSYVARYEGVDAIKQAIEQALRCNSRQWYIIASRDNFMYHTSKNYQQYYLNERKRRGITAKTLWEPTDDLKTPSVSDVFYRSPRILPENFRGNFKSLVILYDDTVLIVDPYSQKTAHAIHGKASADLLRLVFESIWQMAKPAQDY